MLRGVRQACVNELLEVRMDPSVLNVRKLCGRLAAGSLLGVEGIRLSGVVIGDRPMGRGRFESADNRFAARIAGIAFRRALECKSLQSHRSPCQG